MVIRSIALALLILTGANAGATGMSIPTCAIIERWVTPMPIRPPARHSAGKAGDLQAFTIYKQSLFDELFSNEATTEVFGAPFRNWSTEEISAGRNAVAGCQAEASRARRNEDATRLLIVAQQMNATQQLRSGPRKAPSASAAEAGAPMSVAAPHLAASGAGGNCATVHQWVSSVMSYAAIEDYARAQSFKLNVQAIRENERHGLLSDPATLAGFGKALSKWDRIDFANNRDLIDRCRLQARASASRDLEGQLEIGRGAVMNYWSSKGSVP